MPPAELRGNSRAHHIVRWRKGKELQEAVWFRLTENSDVIRDTEWTSPISVKYTFHNWRKIDLDNLCIGLKAALDTVVAFGLAPGDDPDHVRLEAPEFVKCRKGDERTIIEITPAA